MWQDIAFAVIGLSFTIMLVPQVMDAWEGKAALNLWTCLITGLGCIGMGLVDITLYLYYASVVSISTGCMWFVILYYSEKNKRKPGAAVAHTCKNCKCGE
jgi:hypothetical protein